MSGNPIEEKNVASELAEDLFSRDANSSLADAQATLLNLASVFSETRVQRTESTEQLPEKATAALRSIQPPPSLEARYRALVEQIPAVIFMAYLDKGIGEAYVSPQIEAALGFTQDEWLEDPVRWYDRIYPDDKQRWSAEAAEMFLSGKPLKSAYRVVARDGRVLWFHCEAEMIRRDDGPGSFMEWASISRS